MTATRSPLANEMPMSNAPFYHIVYLSSATAAFGTRELLDLLESARTKNARLGITGLLLYKDGDFIQLIEGERAAVEALLHTIKKDPRHMQTTVLLEGYSDERLFSGWSMGFRNLNDAEIQRLPGFSHFMNRRQVAEQFEATPHSALHLFSLFKPAF